MRVRLKFLVLLFAPLLVGCYATGHAPLRGNPPLESASGVRTLSGEKIEFAETGATITNDTLHAVGKHAEIAIPTDSIADISVRKFSWRNTAGLVGGVGGVVFIVWLVHSFDTLGTIN